MSALTAKAGVGGGSYAQCKWAVCKKELFHPLAFKLAVKDAIKDAIFSKHLP